MTNAFSKAQIAKATQVCEHSKHDTVAIVLFGENSRFAAKLVKTRFGIPTVFVSDADRIDRCGLPITVWQGSPNDFNELGVSYFAKRYEAHLV